MEGHPFPSLIGVVFLPDLSSFYGRRGAEGSASASFDSGGTAQDGIVTPFHASFHDANADEDDSRESDDSDHEGGHASDSRGQSGDVEQGSSFFGIRIGSGDSGGE